VVPLFAANFYNMFKLHTPELIFVAEFKTYLVLNNMPIYCVQWTASIECNAVENTAGEIQYGTGRAGAVEELPGELQKALDERHPDYSK
jgi:hypothetical protein